MNKRVTVFLIVLVLFLFGYMYAANKMIVFNDSGQSIDKIIVDTEFSHREKSDVKDGAVLKFTFFSPFDKKVKIVVKQPNKIRTKVFNLRGFFLGEKYNQVLITADDDIESGTLGIDK